MEELFQKKTSSEPRRDWWSDAWPGEAYPAPHIPRWLLLTATALVALSAVYTVSDPLKWGLMMLPAGAVGSIILWRAWLYTKAHVEWVVPALVLILLSISIAALQGALRAGVHYGLAALLCLPVVPVAWSSGIVRKEGFKLYAIYFLWALLTVSYSIAPLFSISRLVMSVLIFLVVAFTATKVENADDVRLMFGRVALACGVLVMANVLSLAILRGGAWQVPLDDNGLPLNVDQAGLTGSLLRFAGFMDNPNTVGLLMLITVSSVLISLPYYAGKSRFVLIVSGLTAIALAVLADSRSPFVALGIGLVCYFVWRYRGWALVTMVAASVLAVFVLPLMGANLADYLGRGDVTSLTGRTDVWDFVLREIRERPLVGYGYEVAGQIFQSRYFPVWSGPWDLGPQSSLHNGFLNRAIGMGIPATLFWLYIVLRPWFALRKSGEDALEMKPILILLVIPLLIYNLTESAVADFSDVTGLLFGMAWAMAEMQRIRWLEKCAAEARGQVKGLSPAVAAVRSLARV